MPPTSLLKESAFTPSSGSRAIPLLFWEKLFSAIIGQFANMSVACVNQKSRECRSATYLARQTGLVLGGFRFYKKALDRAFAGFIRPETPGPRGSRHTIPMHLAATSPPARLPEPDQAFPSSKPDTGTSARERAAESLRTVLGEEIYDSLCPDAQANAIEAQ
jgi:hypothetical protein